MAQRPALTGPKIGPQRTTKTTQKLTLLPNPEDTGDEPDEESGRDVYSQFTRIKDPTARRDAARLGKADRERLPRVTAYCTASSYNLDALLKFLKSRTKTRSTAPKQFDECIYTPWDYGRSKDRRSSSTQGLDRAGESDVLETIPGPVVDIPPTRERRRSDSALEIEEHTQARRGDLLDLRASPPVTSVAEDGESPRAPRDMVALRQDTHDAMNHPDFDIMVHTPEVFFFEYGTVVIWGMTLAQEKRLLKDLAKFEIEKLAPDDVETEDFNFYYTREYQARIYNDFISLRDRRNYMTKLAISHALAQSVKVRTCTPSTLPQLTRPADLSLRRPAVDDHRRHNATTEPTGKHRPHIAIAQRNQQEDWRAVYPAHQHPSARLGARQPRANVGRAAAGARVRGHAQLSGNGPARGADDRAPLGAGRLARRAARPGWHQAWRVARVDCHCADWRRDSRRRNQYRRRSVCWRVGRRGWRELRHVCFERGGATYVAWHGLLSLYCLHDMHGSLHLQTAQYSMLGCLLEVLPRAMRLIRNVYISCMHACIRYQESFALYNWPSALSHSTQGYLSRMNN